MAFSSVLQRPVDFPQVVLSQEQKETECEACDRASSTRPDIANVRRTLRKSKRPTIDFDGACNIL